VLEYYYVRNIFAADGKSQLVCIATNIRINYFCFLLYITGKIIDRL